VRRLVIVLEIDNEDYEKRYENDPKELAYKELSAWGEYSIFGELIDAKWEEDA
jgi:hypothetical protein